VLTHDLVWFARVPAGPHLTLAGHTHGGQIRLPGLGDRKKGSSKAPLHWDPRASQGARTISVRDQRHRDERRAIAVARSSEIRRAGRDGVRMKSRFESAGSSGPINSSQNGPDLYTKAMTELSIA
jgi:hypothetical protein